MRGCPPGYGTGAGTRYGIGTGPRVDQVRPYGYRAGPAGWGQGGRGRTSLVPRPHPLREKGSGDIRRISWLC